MKVNERSFIFVASMRSRDGNKILAIKQHAREMIVHEGFDGLSMQKLARAAGVSPATIYIYFRDRNDLIMQLCHDANHRMSEATLQNFDPESHFDEGLKVQWMNRAKYCMENPLDMHFMEQIRFSPFYAEAHKTMDRKFLDAMKTFVHNAIARKELVRLPVEVYWSIAFAPLYQLVKYHMSGKGMPGNEKFVLNDSIMSQTLELVLKALKPI